MVSESDHKDVKITAYVICANVNVKPILFHWFEPPRQYLRFYWIILSALTAYYSFMCHYKEKIRLLNLIEMGHIYTKFCKQEMKFRRIRFSKRGER